MVRVEPIRFIIPLEFNLMHTKSILLFLFCLVTFSTSLSAQDEPQTTNPKVVEALKTLIPSFSGNAENCIPYDVYGFKYKKSWIIMLNESENVDAFIIKPPRVEGTYLASAHFAEGVSKIIPNFYYYKQKNKRKEVNDLVLYPFYKLKWKGKKAMKGLLYIEIPDPTVRPKFFLWRVFAKKQEEVKAEAESLKPDFQSAIDGTNEQLEQEATEAIATPSAEDIKQIPEKKGWFKKK